MILDKNLLMCSATTVSTAIGTALQGDVIDLGAGPTGLKNAFRGLPALYLVVTVTSAFTSGGAATVNLICASDAQAAIAVDGTATVHWQSGALAVAGLTANRRFIIPLPNDPDTERFVGMLVTTAAFVLTAGAITAEITSGIPHDWVAHADAVN